MYQVWHEQADGRVRRSRSTVAASKRLLQDLSEGERMKDKVAQVQGFYLATRPHGLSFSLLSLGEIQELTK